MHHPPSLVCLIWVLSPSWWPSVNLIAAQRLLRRCVDCKEPIDVLEQSLIDLGAVPEELENYAVQHGKVATCNNMDTKAVWPL